jgi:hypothetical protein
VKSIHDILRARLLDGIETEVPDKRSLSELRRTQWSKEFEDYMRNRLLFGRFRYGDMSSPEKGKYDNIGSAIRRLQRYKEDGNQELLVDAANLCMIEFVHPNHPDPHFTATDDEEHVAPLA